MYVSLKLLNLEEAWLATEWSTTTLKPSGGVNVVANWCTSNTVTPF